MRNISFSMTEPQFLAGTKTVTRRMGWLKLKAGDRLRAVDKVMGFKAGESPRQIGIVEVVSVRREPLLAMSNDDCAREGFPQCKAVEFVAMFCKAMRCAPEDLVTRIEFRTVKVPPC